MQFETPDLTPVLRRPVESTLDNGHLPVPWNGAAPRTSTGDINMKWITREKVKVDRVASPWLVKKFVDKDAEFVFVPA